MSPTPHTWLVAAFASAPILDHADWHKHGPHRVVVCPRAGQLHATQPQPTTTVRLGQADLWVIPTAQRDAARRAGQMIEFCEITLPEQLFDDTATSPAIKRRHPLTLQLVENIHRLSVRDDVTARLLTGSLVDALRLHLIDRFTTPSRAASNNRRTFSRADQVTLLNYLDQNGVDIDASVAALAEHVGMTVGAFKTAFAATFHTTPYQFVIERRIAHAKSLLATTTQSITEISAALGFSTHSHFSTTFKQRVGMTPTRYRAENAPGN